MVSLWEQQSFLEYDVIVVGAGISGLSTAASIKERRPTLRVLVIERGSLPSGASTKNAGFACFGSLTELLADLEEMSESQMTALVERRWSGLQKTISRLGESAIDLQKKKGYELINDLSVLDQIPRLNALLEPLFHQEIFSDQTSLLDGFGFGKTKGIICNDLEAQLDTGKLMERLWDYCSRLGVKIITGTQVNAIHNTGKFMLIDTPDHQFQATAAALCTNAFSQPLLPQKLELKPGRGQVMLIKPATSLPFEGTFHYDEGYFYFRDYHGYLLFGGGRNLDLANESTTEFGINEIINQRLIQDVKELILPGQKFEVLKSWSGIMAFGPNKTPIIQQLEPGLFAGIRLGGMGVAIGSLVGEELAELIIQSHY